MIETPHGIDFSFPFWGQVSSRFSIASQTQLRYGCVHHRYWIWVGVGYLWGFWLLLTGLTVLVLKYMDPEKSRPSIDDGASAAEQMTMQQRVTKAVSLKQLGNSESHFLISRPFHPDLDKT